jgi:hypothetical protein
MPVPMGAREGMEQGKKQTADVPIHIGESDRA